MLVSGFPGRGYLSAASPMLVAICASVMVVRYIIHITIMHDICDGLAHYHDIADEPSTTLQTAQMVPY